MIVASCLLTLHLPDARSLKDKRQVLQGLLRKLRDRHNVSALEVGSQDLWQKAELGVALAARDRTDAERRLERVRTDAEDITGLKTVDVDVRFH